MEQISNVMDAKKRVFCGFFRSNTCQELFSSHQKKSGTLPYFFFDEMRTVLGIFVRVETDISKVLHCDMEEKGIGIGIGL